MCIWVVTYETEKRGVKDEQRFICFARQAHAALYRAAGRDKRYVIRATIRRKYKNMSWEDYKAQHAEELAEKE